MLATRSELLEKIRLGEDSFLELKEVRFAGSKVRGPTQDDLADELAAFANSAGGVLVLGVENKSRAVIGIELDRLDAVEAVLREACEQSIKPSLAPIIERLTLPDAGGFEQPVIRIEVNRSLFVHQSPGGYLHRIGSSKRPIAPDQLARLFQQRSQSRLIRFDETPVSVANLDDLSEPLWRRFALRNTPDDDVTHLKKLAMVREDEAGVLRPTVAGLLMGSERGQAYLPVSYIQAVAYRGTTVVPEGESLYQLDAQDITGPLDRQILHACDFVRRNMRIQAFKKESGGRVDVPQFSMRAVFEAITNAVAHRDYSMPGSKVRLRLFADRLEIYTPGMLVNTMSPEDFPLRQAARNEVIASFLARCPVTDPELGGERQYMMDRRGEGVPVILEQSIKLADRSPTYQVIGQSELLLTIYAAEPEQTA
ncbi:MAG: putative DNA binding domain-containing protein [Pseudomonadales bacterium]|jgi:predicted HTH transcriptional regulator|nr:putative DNA binding domain-containing protein [Pseudomonadales bacterium]